MAKHIKPTQEELDAAITKADEELESIEAEEQKKALKAAEEIENEDDDVVDEDVDQENDEMEDEEEDSDDDDEVEDDKEEEKKPKQDYKRKFQDSSREAQVLYAKNKKVNQAIEDAANVTEPTEEELKSEYSDWDDMTSTEQRLAKDNYINKKKFDIIQNATKEFKDIEAWNKKVDEFVDDPKTLVDNPRLEGKIEEFKRFAEKETRRGVDFEDLISAFLYNHESTKPPKKKGKMLEKSSGSKSNKRSDGKLSVEQGRVLMKTNYKRYKQLLMAGKIANI